MFESETLNLLIKTMLITLGLIGLLFLTFYLLIGVGLSPKLQTIWVTTAMTTMEHQWLATSIIDTETIDKIMAENYVDDSGYQSEIIDIKEPKPETPKLTVDEFKSLEETESYRNQLEGYEHLEDGISLKEVSGTGWRGYVMKIDDPLRVKLVDTPNQYTLGWTVKKMVESVNAVAGVNGGGFDDPNYESNGGMPTGLLIENSKLVYPRPENYNPADKTTYPMIGINKDGVLVLRHVIAQWALENDIVSAVSFRPFIVVNGEGTIKSGTGGWGIAPRTAIGQKPTGEILFLVIDGRQPTWSIGVDLKVLQDVMLEEGAINAAMLDGGSSTVMVYNNEFVNKPSLGKERYINNAWVVMGK